MKFLIVGGGSIGKRHLGNLLNLAQEASVVEPVKSRASDVEKKYKAKVYLTLRQSLREKYDAAIICNPNVYHISNAIRVAEKGLHLFIEKPLSHNLNGIDKLIRLVRKKRLYTFMGSNFKFHPSFRLMKKLLAEGRIGRVISFTVIAGQYLPDWHPWEDYRKGYSANKSLGGGVLLDSHEFDYIQWFLGPIKKIACITGRYSNLQIDTEDLAEAIVELKGRTVGNIHVDYIQHPYRRTYYFYGQEGTLEWSYLKQKVSLYNAKEKKWLYFKEDKNYNFNQMFIDEMKHFLRVLEGKEKSISDIYTALDVLKVIQAAKESSKLKCFVNVN